MSDSTATDAAFAAHRKEQELRWQQWTVEERLAWLEEAKRFVLRLSAQSHSDEVVPLYTPNH